MKQMDTNQDGHVTRLEFLNYHLKQAGLLEEEAVDGQKIQEDFQVLRECKDPEQVMHLARRVFCFLDADKNGYIEPIEIENFLKNISMFNIDNLVKQYAHLPTQR